MNHVAYYLLRISILELAAPSRLFYRSFIEDDGRGPSLSHHPKGATLRPEITINSEGKTNSK